MRTQLVLAALSALLVQHAFAQTSSEDFDWVAQSLVGTWSCGNSQSLLFSRSKLSINSQGELAYQVESLNSAEFCFFNEFAPDNCSRIELTSPYAFSIKIEAALSNVTIVLFDFLNSTISKKHWSAFTAMIIPNGASTCPCDDNAYVPSVYERVSLMPLECEFFRVFRGFVFVADRSSGSVHRNWCFLFASIHFHCTAYCAPCTTTLHRN
jgi:hypothetical protein